MANQWNNLQVIGGISNYGYDILFILLQLLRRVNIEFTVIFAVVLLDGLKWRYTASSQPNINTIVKAPVNPILLFAIDT
jgi:hypothetical protein